MSEAQNGGNVMERLTSWNEEYGCWSYHCGLGWDAGCGRYRAGDGLHTKKMKVSGLLSKAKAIEAWNRRADNG